LGLAIPNESDLLGEKVLLVTGKFSFVDSGAASLLEGVLRGREVCHVFEFETEPKREELERLLGDFWSDDFSSILAVGGGSVIDMAKLFKAFGGGVQKIEKVLHEGKEIELCDVPLIVVPTTAGSGSEATHFAVIYDGKEKFSVAHEGLLPDEVWFEADLLLSVPRHIAASAAMDAFCQGIESYWSIHSTEESKSFAAESIRLAWRVMLPTVLEGDKRFVECMAMASNLAGKAINLTKTTACHAISYAFSSYYGVKHGHAVGLTIGEMLKFNAEVVEGELLDTRGVDYVAGVVKDICGMIGADGVDEGVKLISERMDAIGLARDFGELGLVREEDLETIVRHGFNPQRVNNNPRRLDEADLRKMMNRLANKFS